MANPKVDQVSMALVPGEPPIRSSEMTVVGDPKKDLEARGIEIAMSGDWIKEWEAALEAETEKQKKELADLSAELKIYEEERDAIKEGTSPPPEEDQPTIAAKKKDALQRLDQLKVRMSNTIDAKHFRRDFCDPEAVSDRTDLKVKCDGHEITLVMPKELAKKFLRNDKSSKEIIIHRLEKVVQESESILGRAGDVPQRKLLQDTHDAAKAMLEALKKPKNLTVENLTTKEHVVLVEEEKVRSRASIFFNKVPKASKQQVRTAAEAALSTLESPPPPAPPSTSTPPPPPISDSAAHTDSPVPVPAPEAAASSSPGPVAPGVEAQPPAGTVPTPAPEAAASPPPGAAAPDDGIRPPAAADTVTPVPAPSVGGTGPVATGDQIDVFVVADTSSLLTPGSGEDTASPSPSTSSVTHPLGGFNPRVLAAAASGRVTPPERQGSPSPSDGRRSMTPQPPEFSSPSRPSSTAPSQTLS